MKHPRKDLAVALSATVMLMSLAGCGDKAPAATPTVTPSVVPSLPPSVSVTPTTASATPSTSTTPATADDAIALYRTYFDAFNRSLVEGGVAKGDQLPSDIASVVAEDAASGTLTFLQNVNQLKLKRVSGDITIMAVRKAAVPLDHKGSTLTLESCEDGRTLRTKKADGTVVPGVIAYVVTTYKVIDGQLKLTYIDDSKTVKTCPIE